MAPAWIHSRVSRRPSPRMAVVAHLRHQARLLGHAGHHAGLFDRVGHRLLDVDVLARRSAASVIGACMWSGVAIITASMSRRLSNIAGNRGNAGPWDRS